MKLLNRLINIILDRNSAEDIVVKIIVENDNFESNLLENISSKFPEEKRICLLNGNLNLDSTNNNEAEIVASTNDYRDCGWDIPSNSKVFATDGGGDPYIIYKYNQNCEGAIVHVAMSDDKKSFYLVAQNITTFLKSELSCRLIDTRPDLVKKLGLPHTHISDFSYFNEDFKEIYSFYNPKITYVSFDLYTDLMNEEELLKTCNRLFL